MQIIALDGVPLRSDVNTPRPMTVSHYVFPPASRIEFIVTGPAPEPRPYLRTNCFDSGPSGLAMPAAMLAIDRSRIRRRTAEAAPVRAELPAAQPYRYSRPHRRVKSHARRVATRVRSISANKYD